MYKSILLAIDLEDESSWEHSGPVAVNLAKTFGAELHLMTVVPDFGATIVANYFPDDFENKALDEANARLHAWVNSHVPDEVLVQHIVGHGRAYEEILRVAGEIPCDLIILGARHSDNDKYPLGPNSAQVVRHADQSVLVVRDVD